MTVSKTINHNLGDDQIIKLVKQSFNSDKRYTHDEVMERMRKMVTSFGRSFKQRDLKKYAQFKIIDTSKNGKRIRLYQIIK